MRLTDTLLLAFLAVSVGAAAIVSLSSRRAVHALLARGVAGPARARFAEIERSLDVGLLPGNERLLQEFLQGTLAGFGASYAVALDREGRVARHAALPEMAQSWDRPERPAPKSGEVKEREILLGDGPFLEIDIPVRRLTGDRRGPAGRLVVGFSLAETRRQERRIALQVFAWTFGSTAAGLLVVNFFARRVLRREESLRGKEEKLRQTEKLTAVGQLAAGIAHEINNPLGSILGFAQAAARRLAPTDELSVPVAGIEEEARRCKRIVSDLLTFSRQSEPRLEVFELGSALDAALTMVWAQARVRGVSVERRSLAPAPVRADRDQLMQVAVNLCANALDAMPDGGRLTVWTGRDDGGRIYLEVEDTGAGIAEEHKAHVFEPFFTTKELGRGTGLGLSLVHEIVTRHGGEVSLRSSPGRGSAFRVLLPAAG